MPSRATDRAWTLATNAHARIVAQRKAEPLADHRGRRDVRGRTVSMMGITWELFLRYTKASQQCANDQSGYTLRFERREHLVI